MSGAIPPLHLTSSWRGDYLSKDMSFPSFYTIYDYQTFIALITINTLFDGRRGSVEALSYKPEGHGFDS
jgi:hypothetical protein